MVLSQKDIISIKDFSKKDIIETLKLAEKMEPIARSREKCDVLSGKILGALFYEPSTRTRLSFEAAMQRLGGGSYRICRGGCKLSHKGRKHKRHSTHCS